MVFFETNDCDAVGEFGNWIIQLGHSDRNDQRGGRASRARDREAAVSSRGLAAQGKNDAADRPGASGHRFGPDLACSECGILWDVHQREPKPCKTDVAPDVFGRRPSGDFEGKPGRENAADAAKTAALSSSSSPPAAPTPSATTPSAIPPKKSASDSPEEKDRSDKD